MKTEMLASVLICLAILSALLPTQTSGLSASAEGLRQPLFLMSVPSISPYLDPGRHTLVLDSVDDTAWRGIQTVTLGWSGRPATTTSPVKLTGQVSSEDGRGLKSHVTVFALDLEEGPTDTLAETDTTDEGSYLLTVAGSNYYLIEVVSIGSYVEKFGLKFIDHMQTRKAVAATSPTVVTDFVLQKCGNLWVEAYDYQGRKLQVGELLDRTTRSDGFGVFPLSTVIYDRSVGYLRRAAAGNEPYDQSEPAVQIPVNKPMKIATVWEVPGAGKLIFEADNGGEGFKLAWRGVASINLVYEFARTEYRKTESEYDKMLREGYAASVNATSWLQAANGHLDAARLFYSNGDGAGASSESYQVLYLTVKAREQLALDVASRDIQRYRMGVVSLSITGSDGKPLSNRQVTVTQIDHDFVFSVGGVSDPSDIPALRVLKDFGVEVAQISLTPRVIHPSVGEYRYGDLDRMLDGLTSLGYRLSIHNLFYLSALWNTFPSYYYTLTADELAADAEQYITNLVSRIGDRALFWIVLNEVNEQYGNPLGLSREGMLKLAVAAFESARSSDPDGTFAIGFGNPIGGVYLYDSPSWDNYSVNGERFLDLLDAKGVEYNAIFLQSHQGTLTQGFDFGTYSNLLDYYGQRGKPVYLTSGQYCNFEGRPDLVMTRWWHEGYDDQTQSDYLRYYFTIAFSKQYARAVGWYELMDRAQQHNDPTRFGRGLLDENLNPRPVAYVMRNLIRSWTTTMNLTTDSSGIIRFRGFAGNYLLLVPDYQNATFHVTEGRLNTMEAQLNSKETVSSSTNTAILSMNAVLTTLGTVILAATILLYLRVRMRNRVVR